MNYVLYCKDNKPVFARSLEGLGISVSGWSPSRCSGRNGWQGSTSMEPTGAPGRILPARFNIGSTKSNLLQLRRPEREGPHRLFPGARFMKVFTEHVGVRTMASNSPSTTVSSSSRTSTTSNLKSKAQRLCILSGQLGGHRTSLER